MADYKNLKASDGTGNAVLATITNNRAVSGTILEVTSVENWPNEFIVMTGTLDANGYIEAASATEMKAHLTGTDIEIDSFEPGYTDVGNTSGQVAIIKMTTSWADDITELAQVSHNDDGTLKDNIVTSTMLNLDGYTDANGWEIYDFGLFKMATKKVSDTTGSLAAGATVAKNISGSNLPVGMTNQGDAMSIQATVSTTAFAFGMNYNIEGSDDSTSVGISAKNIDTSTRDFSYRAFTQIIF